MTPQFAKPRIFLSTPSAGRATRAFFGLCHDVVGISIHALRGEGDSPQMRLCPSSGNFYPRPPRGGRRTPHKTAHNNEYFYPRPPRGGRPAAICAAAVLKLFLSTPSAGRATSDPVLVLRELWNFYPRPPRGGRPICKPAYQAIAYISIHALRGEGDSKNGEKHLRFCFIIKRSAQIWKSLSKNIRKNSCDLHRTA